MSQRNARLCPGDLVEVKTPDEIIQTLDAQGASDQLPFMPEMLAFCGRRFQVARRALTTCFSGPEPFRGFRVDDVVTLDSVRCSGAAHDGCQKACMIFWREAWLRKVDKQAVQPQVDLPSIERLRARLKVSSGPKIYYCQASELSRATHSLSRWERFGRHLSGLRSGNFNTLQMVENIGTWISWKIRSMFLGAYPQESRESKAMDVLNLQPGEWVEVKSLQGIVETLDERGFNRGLYFSPDMRAWCGRRCRVKARLDKIIVDGTGQMRQLRNTVCLEGSTCGCSYMGFGRDGCSRCELTYWREIWLRRPDGHGEALVSQH
jgi:hypothetical protein